MELIEIQDRVFEILRVKTEDLKKGERIKMDKNFLQLILPVILEKIREEDEDMLKMIDLSEVCFDGFDIRAIDFSGTNANIDPQKVFDKSLE